MKKNYFLKNATKTSTPLVLNCEKKSLKNIFTGLFLLLFTLLGFSDAFGQSPSVFTTSGTWTCPQGVTTIQVEAWGGGAGGRSTANTNGHVGGGGGGGAYARRNAITVVPGATYTITVGTGGAANTAGTASTATINGVTITAAGGSVGAASGTGTPAGGTGGTIAGSVGDVRFAGGNGGSGFGSGASGGSGSGGGGGSAAGSTGTGNNGNNATNTITPGNGGATVANFGGAGGNGGNNGNGFAATTNYGGGGGGAGHKNNTGGSGMNGAVIITFSCPVNIVNAGPDQTLTACATTATLAGSTVTAGTGTWTLISGTATITSPNSPTSGITGIVPGTSVTLRWTIDNGRCGSGFDEVTITSPIGPGCLSYCTPTGNLNCTLNDFISNVTYNTLNNTSTCAAGGYINYPATGSQTTTVIKGTTYNLSLSVGNGTGTHGAGVWIDWNQDGDFLDLNEFYLISNAIAASSTTVIPITVPLTAATGNLRMRIRYAYALTVTSTMSCTMPGTYGETEDYTITTIDPALCTIPLAQPTALNLTPAGSTISGGFIAASPAADNYLVVVSTSATPPSAPVNGTTYTVGGTLAPGYTIVDTDNNTTFTASGLTPLTTYYFYIYSFNSLCTGGPLYLGTSPLTGSTTTTTADYCTPTIGAAYATSTSHHIRKVEFIGTLQDVINTSTFPSVAPFGYTNFTGLAVKSIQAKGEGVNIYMESPASGYIKAWVDWNADGDFADAGETVYDAGGTAQASTTLGFIVPTAIPTGDYRVRLRISGRNVSGTDAGFSWNSCTTNLAYFGETEDYILRVIENCPARIATVTNGFVCGSGTVTLNVTGTAGTTEFRWYTAQTGGTPIATTATGSWTTPSITTTTVYWVTAFNGSCETLVRTKITAQVRPVPTLSFATSNTEVCGENSIVALTATGDNEIIHLINENFEGGLGSFTNVHYVSNPAVNAQTAWQIRTSPFVPTGLTWFPAIQSNFGANNFAFVNSDIGTYSCPPAGSQCYYTIDNGLVSSTVNSTGFLSLTFKFRMYFDRYYPEGSFLPNELMTVDVSTNGGTTWNPISGNIVTDAGYGTRFSDFTYDLSAYINQANLRVRVRYFTNTWANGAAVDDIELYGLRPLSTALNWSGTPLPDVFTDAATTIPYVAGTPATTVYVRPNLAQLENGSYTFTATATLTNGCAVSQNITINNKSNIWKGTVSNDWSNPNNWSPPVVPDANSCVIIPSVANSNGNKSEIIGPGYNGFGKTLEVKADGVLEVNSVNTLTITDGITVAPTGTFLIEDSSSLIQVNNIANIGNIRMQRNTNIRRLDYVYWSSPVASFASNAISPLTPTGYIYKWAPTTTTSYASNFGNWVAGNETMALGRGYIVRGPDNFTTTKQIHTANFVGVPNNGIITTPISRSTYTGPDYLGPTTTPVTANDDNWNLIGNPYPSAVNADSFLSTNSSKIAGFVKIWTHGTLPLSTTADPFYQNYVSNYTVADYITHNALGGTQPGFDGFIPAGQGFFVLMNDAAATPNTVEFNNTMRSRLFRNDQFFRSENATTSVEKHRIWLQLISPQGTESKSLVGYTTEATNGIDHLYDAINVGVKTNFELYSVADNNGLCIQGRALPFDSNDRIGLGVNIPSNGNYTIAIAAVDGLFTNSTQTIYLEDTLLGITHDLRVAPYSFTATTGRFENRFVLKFNNETLGDEDFIGNNVTVYTNESINISAPNQVIKSVRVHDLLGRVLGTFNNVNSDSFSSKNIAKTQSPLLVEVTLENGATKTYKVIF